MRHSMKFALALLVSFAMTDAAEAGKKNKNKVEDVAAPADDVKVEEAAPAADAPLEMAVTGVADVDAVFAAAVAPLNNIRDAKNAISSLNTNLTTALGLPAGTPFADALADLKTKAEGKITVAVDAQGMPALSPGDAVPANVQTAIDAVNNGLKDVMTVVAKLAELPGQVKEVIGAASALSPQTLISSGVKPLEAPKLMKSVTGNLKVLGAAPGEASALVDAVGEMKNAISSSFGA